MLITLLVCCVAAPPPEPEVNWRLRDPDGSLNWGLLTFVALAAACATVWGALVAQWAAYCRWACGLRSVCLRLE